MRFELGFPKDSKNPLKGMTVVVVEIGPAAIRDCFEESGTNKMRFISCVVDLMIYSVAAEWCRSMGVPRERMEECIEVYSLNQGERIRENAEAAVKKWIIESADILKRCDRNRTCIMAALESNVRR
jgi:hypothetical protein